MEGQTDQRRVIRVVDYSPALELVLWLLGYAVALWFIWDRAPEAGWSRPFWLVIGTLIVGWKLLTDRGLIVEIDQVRAVIVLYRMGLWGSTFDSQVREIPFDDVLEVEVKRRWIWWSRLTSDTYRARLRLKTDEHVDVTRPAGSLEATSNVALWIGRYIGLAQPPRPVD